MIRWIAAGKRSTSDVVVDVVVVVARTVVVDWPLRVVVVVVIARRAMVVVVARRSGVSATVVVVKIVVVEVSMIVEVVEVGSIVVVVGPATTTGAIGVTASMLDSAPVPTPLIARILTWYSTPLVSPAMFNGDVTEPVGHGVHVVPLSVEYSWLVSADPPAFPDVNSTEIARSLAVSWVMVGAYGKTAEISKDCVTSVAALKFAEEPREAVNVHVPEKTMVTVVPDTVHTLVVDEASVTASPEVDVGPTVNVDVEKLRSAGSAKVIVWLALVTVMVMVLDVASRKFPCAALVAVTSQVPAAVPVSVEPEMEQEPVPSTAVKVTAPVPSPPDVDSVVEVP